MSGNTETSPRSLFASLIHATDDRADSIVLGGLAVILAYCAICGWDVAMNGREFSPTGFGAGAAAILGAIGAAKRVRDGVWPGSTPSTTSQPPSAP